jgi:hypothetical protein
LQIQASGRASSNVRVSSARVEQCPAIAIADSDGLANTPRDFLLTWPVVILQNNHGYCSLADNIIIVAVAQTQVKF